VKHTLQWHAMAFSIASTSLGAVGWIIFHVWSSFLPLPTCPLRYRIISTLMSLSFRSMLLRFKAERPRRELRWLHLRLEPTWISMVSFHVNLDPYPNLWVPEPASRHTNDVNTNRY
jgi:hypothetical protein